MTKDEFLKALLSEGFVCEKKGQYPTVVCEADKVRQTAKKVKTLAKDKGYEFSFAVRCYREGMELISNKEPIPMPALSEDQSA